MNPVAAEILTAFDPARLKAELELEGLYRNGEVIGLSRAETDEVITAWLDWYKLMPFPVDWDRLRSALAERAIGVEWRPSV